MQRIITIPFLPSQVTLEGGSKSPRISWKADFIEAVEEGWARGLTCSEMGRYLDWGASECFKETQAKSLEWRWLGSQVVDLVGSWSETSFRVEFQSEQPVWKIDHLVLMLLISCTTIWDWLEKYRGLVTTETAARTCTGGLSRPQPQMEASAPSKHLWRVYNVPSTGLGAGAQQGALSPALVEIKGKWEKIVQSWANN